MKVLQIIHAPCTHHLCYQRQKSKAQEEESKVENQIHS
jgi:hypothetical protein